MRILLVAGLLSAILLSQTVIGSRITASALIPPNAPEEFAVAPGEGEVSMVWSLPNAGGISDPDVTSFKIYKGSTSSTTSFLTSVSKSGSLVYKDNAVTNGQQYCYRVTAVVGTVEGATTVTKCVIPHSFGSSLVKQEASAYSSASIPYNRDPIIAVARTNDYLQFSLSVPSAGSYDLMVYAKDDAPAPVNADVALDGTTKGSISFTTGDNAFHERLFTLSSISSGSHNIRLTFTNDQSSGPTDDRNFYLRWIRIPGPLTSLHMASVNVNPSTNVDMDSLYSLDIGVQNSGNTASSGTITIQESGMRADYSDTVGPDNLGTTRTQTMTISPGTQHFNGQQFSFTHHWQWLEPLGFVGTASDLLGAWEFLSTIINLDLGIPGFSELIQLLVFYNTALVSNTYHYNIGSNFGDTSTATVTANVPLAKQQAFYNSLLASFTSGIATDAAFGTGILTGGIGGIAFGITQLGLYEVSVIEMKAAEDPDSNYMEIVKPVPIFIAEVDSMPDGNDKLLATTALQLLSDVKAMEASEAKLEGAKAAGDEQWVTIQTDQTNILRKQVESDLSALKLLLNLQFAYYHVNITPQLVDAAKEYVQSNGFPPAEKQAARELNISDEDLHAFQQVFLVIPDTVYVEKGTSGIDAMIDLMSDITPPSPPLTASVVVAPAVLNTLSKGKYVTAYVELEEGDITKVLRATLAITALNGQPLDKVIPAQLKPTSIGDINGNGKLDLMVKFDRNALEQNLRTSNYHGTIVVQIRGLLNDLTGVSGTANIVVG